MTETGQNRTEAEALHAEPGNLKDGWIRILFIPLFGIGIPNVTGLFGMLDYHSGVYWLGYALFILLSFLIWHGNRFFLLRQRQYLDWFNHPVRKIMVLVFANVFFTAPLTVFVLMVWDRLAGFGTIRWDVIEIVTLMNVIAVAFITHVYETVYLIRQRENDLLSFEKLERAKAQAELEALKGQIDPHFMFNSLNTLSYLIEEDPKKAHQFNDSLADVYRYILQNRNRELVYLKEEIDFVNSYVTLLQLRFGNTVRWSPLDEQDHLSWLIPPISLQILVENAVKHNQFDENHPLLITTQIQDQLLCVKNAVRQKINRKDSPGIGLKILTERYLLIVKRSVDIVRHNGTFEVRLPLIKVE